MVEWMKRRAGLFVAALLVTGWVRAGDAEELRSRDFVPREALFYYEIPDPGAYFEMAMGRIEAVTQQPGMRQMLFMALGANQGEAGLDAVLARFGWRADQPVGVGMVPMVEGAFIDGNEACLGGGGFFVVLPLADTRLAEQTAHQALRPAAMGVRQRCGQLCRLLSQAPWLQAVKAGTLSLDAALDRPGYRCLACPAGGVLRYDAEQGRILCDRHAGGGDQAAFQALPQATLAQDMIGPFVVAHSPELGVGYAVGAGHCVLAGDVRVVRHLVQTAVSTDGAARLRVNWKTEPQPLAQGVMNWQALAPHLEALYHIHPETAGTARPALGRLLALVRDQPPLTYTIHEEEGTTVMRGRMPLGPSPWAQRLAAIPPSPLELAHALPAAAGASVVTNILTPLLEVVVTAVSAFGDREAVFAEFLPLLGNPTWAWAMTHAEDGGIGAGRTAIPHMWLLGRPDSEGAKRLLSLLPEAVARARRWPAAAVDGVTAYRLPPRDGQGEGEVLMQALHGPLWSAAVTDPAVVRSLAEAAGTPPPPRPFPGADLGPQRPAANLRLYLDAETLGTAIRNGQAFRRSWRARQRCATVLQSSEAVVARCRAEGKDAPVDLQAVAAWAEAQDPPLPFPKACPEADRGYRLEGGVVFCPEHGSLANPTPLKPRQRGGGQREQWMQTMVKGIGALRLEVWVEDKVLEMEFRQKPHLDAAPAGGQGLEVF